MSRQMKNWKIQNQEKSLIAGFYYPIDQNKKMFCHKELRANKYRNAKIS